MKRNNIRLISLITAVTLISLLNSLFSNILTGQETLLSHIPIPWLAAFLVFFAVSSIVLTVYDRLHTDTSTSAASIPLTSLQK